MRLRAYLLFLSLATLLPVAVFAGVVGYFLVQEERETFRRGAEARTLAMSTAVDTELNGSIAPPANWNTLGYEDGEKGRRPWLRDTGDSSCPAGRRRAR